MPETNTAANPAPFERRTNGQRFALGLLTAIATGAGLVSLPFALVPPFILFGIIAFPIAALAFGAGVLVLGAPAWLVLNRFGVRSRGAALILGALLSGGFVFAWSTATRQMGVSLVVAATQSLWMAAAISLAGAAAGLTGWSVAYRPETPLKQAEIDEVFG